MSLVLVMKMMMMMKSEIQETIPEFLFLKYKGVPAPWEIIAQSKRLGFKCKKYANWSDVHVSESSRQMLKSTGDALIDSGEFDLSEYGEISKIWERVQRWTKDKDSFSIEPDILQEYEKISRITDIGSKKPEVVDLMINEFGYDSDQINLDDRWLLFLAISVHNFIFQTKRYQFLVQVKEGVVISTLKVPEFIGAVSEVIVQLYLHLGFDLSANEDVEVISLFIRELGCCDVPAIIERSANAKIKQLPKVWTENYDGGPSELVKFQYLEGNIIVKLNKTNKIFKNNSSIGNLLINQEFWTLIGNSLHSHVNQIDEIQDFFDTFAKQLRLRD
jgi:hypothetical protein